MRTKLDQRRSLGTQMAFKAVMWGGITRVYTWKKRSKLRPSHWVHQHGEVGTGGKSTKEAEKGWPKEGGAPPVCGVLDGQ